MNPSDAQIPEVWSQVTPLMRAQVGAVAIVATLAILPVAWLGVKRLVPERNVVFARWGFSHVALALLLFAAASIAVSLFGTFGESLAGDLLILVSLFAAVVAAIGVWAVRLDPEGLRVLGFRARGAARATTAGILAYVAALPGILGLILVWTWLLEVLGHTPAPQDVARRFAELEPAQYALPVVLGVVVQPLLEEVVFRSFLQPLLVQNFRETAGIGLTSLIFAALHGPDVFVPIFALSCLLGAVMLRTQSVFAVWAMHALNNGLMFALLAARPDLAGAGGGS